MSQWQSTPAVFDTATTAYYPNTAAPAKAPVLNGDTCVWDAFGAFWCEGKGKGMRPGPGEGGSGYVQEVARTSSLNFEAFR